MKRYTTPIDWYNEELNTLQKQLEFDEIHVTEFDQKKQELLKEAKHREREHLSHAYYYRGDTKTTEEFNNYYKRHFK